MLELDMKNYIEESIQELKGRLFPVMTTDISKLSVLYSITDVTEDTRIRANLHLL